MLRPAVPRKQAAVGNNYRHVFPRKDGGWDVQPGATRASAHARTQAEAFNRARDIVPHAGGGEVRIQGRNRQIRNSDTVTHGNDPNPPRDKR